jgi:hypothetical protein
MKAHSHKSPTHRIHTDIQPIISALKHGKRLIASARYQALCQKLNLMRWESAVVSDIIRKACIQKSIPV